jgi:DNA mismatch repair ATPase MutS
MIEPLHYYNTTIERLEKERKEIKKTIFYFYLARLITFVGFAGFMWAYFVVVNTSLILALSFLSLISFLVVVRLDLKYVFREKFLRFQLNINQEEIATLDYQYENREKGEEYKTLNPHLAADFDLFGKASLFQYINRSSTKIGKDKLASQLTKSQRDKNSILQKQKAIQELAQKIDFVQNFQTYGLFIAEKGDELKDLQGWLAGEEDKKKQLLFLSFLVPLVNLIWFTLIGFEIFSFNTVLLPLLFSLSILGFHRKKIEKAHSKLGKTSKIFKKYSSLIKLIEEENFESPFLVELKEVLYEEKNSASKTLRKLFKLLSQFDLRYNVMLSFLLNSLLLYDIHILLRLENWKLKNKNKILPWFTSLSEIDALMGYATFAFNEQKDISYPLISDEEYSLKASEIGHPLLPSSQRINNSFELEGSPSTIIITGANMAGKSTFLRTLASNQILAMCGAPVCAKELVFTPSKILSSIKIQDSLSNNESYFYAELLRLKEIVEYAKTHPNTLIILDEILRGTNTKDKHLGSVGLLNKLMSYKAIVFIATHDLAIGEMEKTNPKTVKNYCFEVELQEEQLSFDYTLKKGISQKLNASFLLQKMKIIE